MNKPPSLNLMVYVLVVTMINVYLWYQIIQAGPVPRAGRMLGLIIMLAVLTLFPNKFRRKRYVPKFIQIGGLIGMTVLLYFLYQRSL